MVLVLIGLAAGIIFAAILIMKISKTNSHDVMGMDLHCIQCGVKTGGAKCHNCERNARSFGV
jgi:hypothetical protein